jgi:hypothetical protein
VRSDVAGYHLVIDIMWADIPLITEGALVHAEHRDHTSSQKWKMVRA